MEELTENAEEGDEEDKQSEQKLGRLNFKVGLPIPNSRIPQDPTTQQA